VINRRADFLPLCDFAWKKQMSPNMRPQQHNLRRTFSTSSRQLIVVDFLPPCVARRESAAPLALFLSHPLQTLRLLVVYKISAPVQAERKREQNKGAGKKIDQFLST
jgi:hypothetical protein